MEGIKDNHWFDMIVDEIGIAFTKVDESIQKGIELWTELTKDIFDDQHTQDSTGQPNSEGHFSQDKPVAEVKERPIQHWSMCLGELKEEPTQQWAMCDSKIQESLIQEHGGGDFYVGDGDDNGNADGEEEEDELTFSESCENMWELDLGNSTSRDIASTLYNHYCEEDSGSSLKRKGGYQLLKTADTSSEYDDESWDNDADDDDDNSDYDEEEEEKELLKTADTSSEYDDESWDNDADDDDDNSDYDEEEEEEKELLKTADTSSEDNDESWDNDAHNDDDDNSDFDDEEEEEKEDETTVSKSCEDDDDEEDETTVSESSEIMWELNLGASATSYTPSSYHHHTEEDTGSSLKWTSGSCEDDVKLEDCHSEDVEEEMEMLWNHMSDFSNESLVVHEDEDDVSDKLQGFVDGQENITNSTEFGEVETLCSESDWVFVTRD